MVSTLSISHREPRMLTPIVTYLGPAHCSRPTPSTQQPVTAGTASPQQNRT